MPAYKSGDGRWRYRGVYEGKPYSGSSPKGNNTKKAAEALEKAHLEKLERRVFTGKMPTVRQFIAQFLEFQKGEVKQLTYALQRVHLEKHVDPVIGSEHLDDVGKRQMDLLKTTWSQQGAKPRTINSRLGTTMRMFAVAVDWKYITELPEVDAVSVPKDTVRFFTEDEAHRLLEVAHHRWRSMMLVGLRTGLRIGELRGLQWGDVDFTRSQVTVARTDPGIAGMAANAPKGGKPRTVPLTPDALAALRTEHTLRTQREKRKPKVTEWVWPGVDYWKDQRNRNRTRSEGGCVEAITRAIERAGIEEKEGDRLGWHTLRHTFASWLVIRGITLRVVQDLLGHASIRQTERYAHLAPNTTHHAAVASLDFAFVGSPQRALNAPSDLDGKGLNDDRFNGRLKS